MAIKLTNPMSGDTFKAEVENAVDKRGDTMNDGATLTLGKNPENNMDAATKIYVDNCIKFYTATAKMFDNIEVEICTIPDYEPSKHLVFLCENFRNNGDYTSHYGSFLKLENKRYTYYESATGKSGKIIRIDDSGKVYAEFWDVAVNTGEELLESPATFHFFVTPVQMINL